MDLFFTVLAQSRDAFMKRAYFDNEGELDGEHGNYWSVVAKYAGDTPQQDESSSDDEQ